MISLTGIPILWKIGASVSLAVALIAAGSAYKRSVYKDGYAAAVDDRAKSDQAAIAQRIKDNTKTIAVHTAINKKIEETKNEQLAPVRERIVTRRVYVGTGICGPAASAKSDDAAGGDSGDPARRLVSQRTEEDFRALELKVEEGFATGRACQAFSKEHGFVR